MEDHDSLSQWLKERCQEEHLSLRKLAVRVGVSNVTITNAANGGGVSAGTIKKLASAFSDDGHYRRALEDKLLALAGYRTPCPEQDPSESLARLMDKMSQLNEAQVEMMSQFADFLRERQGK